MNRWLYFITVSLGLITADVAQSCPAFLGADKLPPSMLKNTVDRLQLFTIGSKQTWEHLTLQIDPLDDQSLLDPSRVKPEKVDQSISSKDRLVFYTEQFGQPVDARMGLPCGASEMVEIVSYNKNYAYLVSCSESFKNQAKNIPKVTLEAPLRRIASPQFEYIYNPRNELLYETLTTKTSDGKSVRAAYESDVQLRLDLKRFFTLQFDNTDIGSFVNASKVGELGVVEGIAFYLRLFALKIDLKMNTVASFFENGANLPMLVDVPTDVQSHLNPGSGTLYTLKVDQARFQLDHPKTTMPKVNSALIKSSIKETAKAGLANCTNEHCDYRMMGKVANDDFAIAMQVPRTIVEMGFYPTFVDDVAAFKEELGWKKTKEADPNEKAIYFETSGLAKGRYTLQNWILFGKDAGSGTSCPATATVARTITNASVSTSTSAVEEKPEVKTH